MARKKPKAEAEPAADDIFAHFERHGRSLNPQEAPQRTQQASEAALLERLNALERTNQDLQEQVRRSALSVPGQGTREPGNQGQQIDPKLTRVDLTGIPNQLDNPEEHARVMQERINAALDATRAYERQQAEAQRKQAEQVNSLWEGFSKAYPDWAPFEDLVETVSSKVAAKAKEAGMDMNRYFGASRDLFFADVAKEMHTKFGKLVEPDDEGPLTPASRAKPSENDDDGRTAGIFGGQESGGKASAGNKPEGGADMLGDLQAIQRKMGIY